MYFIVALLISFLCLKQTELAMEQHKLIEKYTQIESLSNPYIKEVKLYNQYISWIEHIITSYNNITESQKPALGHLHGLNLLINCEVAYWTMTKIFEFIKTSPLFYQNKFMLYENYNKEFLLQFKTDFEILLYHVNTTIEKFALLIDKILHLKSYISFYEDTGILKTLFNMLIKSHYLLLSITCNVSNQISHIEILRLIITDMIELQRYVLVSCPQMYSDKKNSQIIGIWIDFNTYGVAKRNINYLLHLANKTMNFDKVKVGFCQVDQLLIVVDICKNTEFFEEIAQMHVRITKDTYLPIKELLKQIQINYDIHVIFWCHETILTAIMKLIVRKIIHLIIHRTDITKVRNIIIGIYYKIGRPYIPSYIVNGFEILNRVDTKQTLKSIQDELTGFLDSLSSVQFESPSQEAKILKKDFEDSENQLLMSVINLLNFILNNMDNFECFQYFFRPVQEEESKYYKTLVISKQYLNPKNNTSHVADDCNFITNIFYLCFQAKVFLNGYRDIPILFQELTVAILNVKYYFLHIVKTVTDNVDMLTIAFKVYTILVNYTPDIKDEWIRFKTIRILYVIMNEMNYYGVKYCISNNSSFLLFNNINFYELGNTDFLYESIDKYFRNNVTNFHLHDFSCKTRICDEDFHYLSVRHIYEHFIINSKVFSEYENKIKIFWNGVEKTIKEVFYNESTFVINAPVVYALYDVYFKYSAAVIFFRMKEIVLTSKFEIIKSRFETTDKQLKIHGNWHRLFPETMKNILNDIYRFLLTPTKSMKILKKIELGIEEKFKKSNIRFEDMDKIYVIENSSCSLSPSSIEEKQLMPDDVFVKILDELFRNLKTFFNYYFRIIQYRQSDPDLN